MGHLQVKSTEEAKLFGVVVGIYRHSLSARASEIFRGPQEGSEGSGFSAFHWRVSCIALSTALPDIDGARNKLTNKTISLKEEMEVSSLIPARYSILYSFQCKELSLVVPRS